MKAYSMDLRERVVANRCSPLTFLQARTKAMLCLKAELLRCARAIVERPVTVLIAPNFQQIRKVPPR